MIVLLSKLNKNNNNTFLKSLLIFQHHAYVQVHAYVAKQKNLRNKNKRTTPLECRNHYGIYQRGKEALRHNISTFFKNPLISENRDGIDPHPLYIADIILEHVGVF